MALRYTVYCKRSVAHVTPDQLLAGTREADLHTIAEDDVPDDDVIVSALNQLRMEDVSQNDFQFYRLCYRPSGKRQIDIERWQTVDEVRVVVAETLETLEAERHPSLNRIRSHLAETVDIVDASFGASPEEQMAPVLASEVTRWLAEKYDGIIRAADNSWWELGETYHEYQPLQCERTHAPEPEPKKQPADHVEVSVNPYKSPSLEVPRPKRPPRKLNGQFWRGIGCLIAGSCLTAFSVYWFLYGTGFMLMIVIALGPALILAGFIYLFFWYDD